MKVTIRVWNGTGFTGREVDALPAGVPGLVIHRAHEAGTLMVTHAATGLAVAEFPGDIFSCLEALGELGDWTAVPDGDMTGRAKKVLTAYDAFPAPDTAPQRAKEAEWKRAGVPVPETTPPAARGHLSAVADS